ncbi:hypothetical protein TWF730_006376 [Orbilia blumenaviensis]|uniref:Uncharacterized protein n=1 Tax=Orbilia blumenaviensis TaxID=1796055 RepID=A0AAV9VE18_9PEZI
MDVIGPLLPRNRRRKQAGKRKSAASSSEPASVSASVPIVPIVPVSVPVPVPTYPPPRVTNARPPTSFHAFVPTSAHSRDYGVPRPATTPLSLPVLNLDFPEDLFDNLTPITFDCTTPACSERSIMDEFPSPPTQHSLFDDEHLRAERRRQRKQAKSQKSSKPERYHHTPAFAAQSFALTATPEIYKTDQTHKLSRPVLDQAKSRRSRTPKVIQPFDDRSSGEYERNTFVNPVMEPSGRSTPSWGARDQKSPKPQQNRFMTASPHYELFSSAILNQNTPGTTGRGVITPDSFTRGRPDWSEMDEKIPSKGLRRNGSIYSTKSSKSQRAAAQSTDFTSVLKGNTVLRVPRAGDAESIYQGRGCVPWRIRAL